MLINYFLAHNRMRNVEQQCTYASRENLHSIKIIKAKNNGVDFTEEILREHFVYLKSIVNLIKKIAIRKNACRLS